MLKLLHFSLFILISLCIVSCASSYKPIQPEDITYSNSTVNNGVDFSYKYDVLRERGNKKYSRKENTGSLKIVSVKIINNSDSTLVVGKNMHFFNPKGQLYLLPPIGIKTILNQNVAGYIPLALLTFVNLSIRNGNTIDVYPIGLILGPALTIGNMVVAGNSNKRLYSELNKFNIIGKSISKNDTLYGIIGVLGTGYDPILLKLKN